MSNGDFDADICTPNDYHRRESDDDVDPEAVDQPLEFLHDLGEVLVQSRCQQIDIHVLCSPPFNSDFCSFSSS